ncbi:MAG: HEAT repeat domain-containing protein [Desulfovibrio sp.]
MVHGNLHALLNSDSVEDIREGAYLAGKDKNGAVIERLVELLEAENVGVQEAAEAAVRQIRGSVAVSLIIPLLRSESVPVRNLAMDILREIVDDDILGVTSLLNDSDSDVRIFGADILGSATNSLALKPLIHALLTDEQVNVRSQAAVSLGRLKMPEASTPLRRALDDEDWVAYAAIEALAAIGDNSAADVLVSALEDSSELIASMIVDGLAEIGNIRVVPKLLSMLDECPVALRNKTLKTIVAILGGGSLAFLSDEDRTKYRRYLQVALEDYDKDIQNAAIRGLAYLGGEEASRMILDIAGGLDPEKDRERLHSILSDLARVGLTSALRDGVLGADPVVAEASIYTLSLMNTSEVVELLKEAFWVRERLNLQRAVIKILMQKCSLKDVAFFYDVLDRHKDGTVLKAGLYFLGVRMQLEESSDRVFGFLSHPYNDVKDAALDACIAIGSTSIVERFRESFESNDPLNRLMAVYALGKIDLDENADLLKRALSDESHEVRKLALEGLGECCAVGSKEMKEIVSRMIHDPSREVRQVAVELAGSVDESGITEQLLNALDDDDDWVRIRALEALGRRRRTLAVSKMSTLLRDENNLVALKAVKAIGAIGGTEAFHALLDVSDTGDAEFTDAVQLAVFEMQREGAV